MSLNPKIDPIVAPPANAPALRPTTPDDLAAPSGWREQLIAEIDGRPVGLVQITDPARQECRNWGCVGPGRRAIEVWSGDLADVDRRFRTLIMKQAIAHCFADPAVTAVLVDPPTGDEAAADFYERLGFEFVVHRRFGDIERAIYRLTRETAVKHPLST